jgi:putative transcriptional regulator
MLKSHLDQLMLTWSASHGKRLTMRQLSEGTGLALGALSRYKSGKVDRIHADTIIALCRFFDCSLCDLIEYLPDTPHMAEQ